MVLEICVYLDYVARYLMVENAIASQTLKTLEEGKTT